MGKRHRERERKGKKTQQALKSAGRDADFPAGLFEGISSGNPLSAPQLGKERERLGERGAHRLPGSPSSHQLCQAAGSPTAHHRSPTAHRSCSGQTLLPPHFDSCLRQRSQPRFALVLDTASWEKLLFLTWLQIMNKGGHFWREMFQHSLLTEGIPEKR